MLAGAAAFGLCLANASAAPLVAATAAPSAACMANAGQVPRDKPHLVVTASPSAVVLGGDGPQEVTIDIEVCQAAEGGAPLIDLLPRVLTTSGRIDAVHRTAPGRYRATLLPPEERFPQLAVVSVVDPLTGGTEPPVLQIAVVAYSTRIVLKGRSEPNVEMRLEVGGQVFGPVTAGPSGEFALPVVVPPGENWARATATDRLGNTSKSTINLYLPEVKRLHACVYPEEVVADGSDVGWVFVTSVSAAGGPEDSFINAKAKHGGIDASTRVLKGVTRFRYRTPGRVGEGWEEIKVGARGYSSSIDLRWPLVAGPPSAVTATVEPRLTPADGRASTTVMLVARDQAGNPAVGLRPVVELEGSKVTGDETAPGTYQVVVPPRDRVGVVSARALVLPQARPCIRPRAFIEEGRVIVRDARGLPCRGVGVGVGVSSSAGAGGGARELVFDLAGVSLDDWRAAAAPVGADRAPAGEFIFRDEQGREHRMTISTAAAPFVARPIAQPLEITWRLPAVTELRWEIIESTAAKLRLRLSAAGVEDLAGRIQVQASAGTVEVAGGGPGVLEVSVLRSEETPGAIDVIATDRESGVSAWARVE